jgi:hypothetical protein
MGHVLASPIETVEVRFLGRASLEMLMGDGCPLFYQINADEVDVVTAFCINEDGLRKYGFTRI